MNARCFWNDPTHVPGPSLAAHEQADYLIVGAGIAGLFAAYRLLEHGVQDIVLVEKGSVGSGSTGHSAGMLVSDAETASWSEIISRHGADAAARYLRAQEDAMAIVKRIATEAPIDCDYRENEVLFLARDRKERGYLVRDFAAREAMGATPALLDGKAKDEEFRSPRFIAGERTGIGESVHPLRFARGFARHLRERGVRIYEGTPLIHALDGIATAPGGTISFKNIIYAVGTAEPSRRVRNYLTTICITRPLSEEELARLALADRDMFVDMGARSYHYGKVTGDNRLLVGYGDLACGKSVPAESAPHEPHVRNVRAFIARAFGTPIAIEHAWTSPYALSTSSLPFVAKQGNAGRVGGAGTQMASAAAASFLVSKFIGKPHPLDMLFPKVR